MFALGNKPPGMVPSKGAYMNHDVARLAKYYQIPLHEMSVSQYQANGLLHI